MSDIVITLATDETPAPGGRMQPANHAAWLEQLESAQWKQRLRYQPSAGQPNLPRTTPDDVRRQAPVGAPAKPAAAEIPSDARREETAEPKPDIGGRPRSWVTTVAARTAARDQAMMWLPTPQEHEVALGGEPITGMALPAKRSLGMQWQARNVHVAFSAEEVRLWLRDANYREGDGQKLLRVLREQFGRLGLRLAQFTLNGSQVSEPAHNGERENTWQ